MEVLSNYYGWTPTEIRNQDNEDIEMYLRIISEKNFLKAREIKKQSKR